MAEVDFGLLRQLQAQLGGLRQAAVEERRTAGLSALVGENARQHDRSLVQTVATNYEAQRAEDGLAELTWEVRQDLVEALEARLFGAGSLDQLLQDPEVENIDINGYRTVFVEYAGGRTVKHRPIAASNEDLVETIQTLAAHEGLSSRAFDAANHSVTLRLPDGSRMHAVQSVTAEPVVSIRRHRYDSPTLKDLVQLDTLDDDLADFLAAAVRARKNIMIAGAVSSGKTTMLRALAREVDPVERIISVERSLELGLEKDVEAHPNAIAMEERLANTEGVGAVTMAELVRYSLRLNPSRVVVGEVLGDEVITMLNAMSQGNNGSLSTIHANSSRDVVHKITTYAIQAPERLPVQATTMLVASALDFLVFMQRIKLPDDEGQVRVVGSIREIAGIDEHGQLLTDEIWAPDRTGRAMRQQSVQIVCESDLRDAGWQTERPGWI